MTHIKGVITKVAEVETRGYDLPNIQTTGLNYEGGNVPGLTRVTIPILENIKNGLMKTFSVTAGTAANLSGFYLTVTDADGVATIFSQAIFWINFKINLNDFPISSDNTYTISLENYNAGIVGFTSNLSYIEI